MITNNTIWIVAIAIWCIGGVVLGALLAILIATIRK